MFATLISFVGSLSLRVEVAQSIPQSTLDRLPEPFLVRTLTAQSRAPGATPTTPILLSSAPIIPATFVPWPFGSSKVLSDWLGHECFLTCEVPDSRRAPGEPRMLPRRLHARKQASIKD